MCLIKTPGLAPVTCMCANSFPIRTLVAKCQDLQGGFPGLGSVPLWLQPSTQSLAKIHTLFYVFMPIKEGGKKRGKKEEKQKEN